MAEIQKMSLASENTLETEYFMPLNHFQILVISAVRSILCGFKDLFWTPKVERKPDEFDIFERQVLTATSKTAFWWSLVLATLVKNDGD